MKAHKYRIYPNEEQKQIFATHFGHTRHVYNWALDLKQKTYKEKQITISKREIQDLLVASKKEEKPWLREVNSQSLLFGLDSLDKAYTRFFKNKNAKQSFSCPQHCRVDEKKQLLTIPKVKNIKIKLHRNLPKDFKTVTISKAPTGKYYASFVIEQTIINSIKDKKILVNANDILGIDLGISDFIITSQNKKIINLRLLDKSLPKLAKWQKINARQKYTTQEITNKEGKIKNKSIYSKNKQKSKINIAKMHEKIANQRNDYLHKISNSIVSESQATYIAIEDLNVKGMIRNKKQEISKTYSKCIMV